jgi:eukaryotic-like serine/threonine-protein kinase
MYREGTVVGGRYRLTRQVGEGGMATVWKAEHLALHSPVALKFLHTAGKHSSELTERFLREARVAASVRHRNVIEITDFGLTDDGMPFMVLEYLHGQSLAQLMEHNPALDPTEAVRIVSLTLRGLAAVHDAGIVHRDLKPENIFLVRDADGSFPKLLDFGVSRRVGLSSDITQEGALIGTPDYMSPEQARGDRDIDLRTDVYSMGVILYETITGRLPFEAERMGDLIRKITSDERPPTVAELRPDLPPDLSAVVARAMAPDREARFSDARQMRYALIDASETYGFRHTNSALISVSELPPPPADGFGSGRTSPIPRARVPSEDPTLAHLDATPSQPTALSKGTASAAHDLGTARTMAGKEAPSDPSAPQRHRGRPLLLLAVLAVGGAATALYLRGALPPWVADGSHASAAEEAAAEAAGPVPWMPSAPGLPDGLFDEGGQEDAEETVRLTLLEVPEDAMVHVDGVPVLADQALPAVAEDYVVEVRAADGSVLWMATHPGTRDGVYAVWRMEEAELDAADH